MRCRDDAYEESHPQSVDAGRDEAHCLGRETAMFMTNVLWAGVLAGLLVLLWRAHARRRVRRAEKAWKPESLKSAVLEYAERTFLTEHPFRLVAKIDRAYRTTSGLLVLTELKRRPRVTAYRSDVVEISAQKVAIENATGDRVADVGYVVVEHPHTKKRTPIPVQLLSQAEIIALAQRYRDVSAGRTIPIKAERHKLCSSCGYKMECRPEVLERHWNS
jgi:CRISPR-associated exonuclease Cas4